MMQAEPSDPIIQWHYVPVAEFRENGATVEANVRTRFQEFWQSVRNPPESNASEIFQPVDSLDALPEPLLRRVAPAPKGNEHARALRATIDDWLAAPHATNAVLLLADAPHAGGHAALRTWAAEAGSPLVAPPTPEQILAGDRTWLDNLPAVEAPWVLPELERCFLRHVRGLTLVRGLLEFLVRGKGGRAILGCSTWALAYLHRVWLTWPATTLTLQALTAEDLSAWFDRLANPGPRRRFLFRQADNGAYVIPPPQAIAEDQSVKSSDFLRRLAVYARGNPGVAAAIWRQGLLADADNPPQVDTPADGDVRHTTIWVSPWERIKHPALPAVDRRGEALVLHALLLHGALNVAQLELLLPSVDVAVAEMLAALQHAGFVERVDEAWQVTAVGYPAARQWLKNEGYLTD